MTRRVLVGLAGAVFASAITEHNDRVRAVREAEREQLKQLPKDVARDVRAHNSATVKGHHKQASFEPSERQVERAARWVRTHPGNKRPPAHIAAILANSTAMVRK